MKDRPTKLIRNNTTKFLIFTGQTTSPWYRRVILLRRVQIAEAH